MNRIWNEVTIREELKKLDDKTGMNGASLPIKFGKAENTIACYSWENGGFFRFSNVWFKNPDWPVEEAINTIRHEYAHYMDHRIYGNCGHGKTWMYCCSRIGAAPIQYHGESVSRYFWDKIAEEEKLESNAGNFVGKSIEHPGFGRGVIIAVTGGSSNRRVSVDFPGVGEKTLAYAWVNKNCKILSEGAGLD